MPVEHALAELRARSHPVDPHFLPIRDTTGCVLAETIRSPGPVPTEATALRDGWAVAAGDVVGASSYAPIAVAVYPPWMEAGQVMPAGTDAVLPPDAVAAQNGIAEIVAETAPGEGIRRFGEDAAPDAILCEAGERVRSSDMAVAMEAGIEQALVREARVRIFSRASVPEASSELVARLAESAGAAVERVRLHAREVETIANALRACASDLILIIGGTGLGREDHVAEALAASGSLIARGIALRPGETSGCGMVGTVPAILVPRRLEAALAAALALVLPALDHLMGATAPLPSLSGPLTRKVSSTVGMTEIVLLRRTGKGLEPLAAGDLTLAAIGAADAWLAVPPDSEGFAAGETVTAFLL